jgi:hypothetical protein
MEINSAVIIGLVSSSYFFLFCIIGYYLNNLFFRKDIIGISIFLSFSKPLYSYSIKNGIKINFGYLPLGSVLDFEADNSVGKPIGEVEKQDEISRRRTKILHITTIILALSGLFFSSLIMGFNPLRIFRDMIVNEGKFLLVKQSYGDFVSFISDQINRYGKYFFIIFIVVAHFIASAVWMVFVWWWKYFTWLFLIVIAFLYIQYDVQYFKFSITFYIDLLLSLIVSGFIYFLSLRFFIK